MSQVNRHLNNALNMRTAGFKYMVGMPRMFCSLRGAEPCIMMLIMPTSMLTMLMNMLSVLISMPIMLTIKLNIIILRTMLLL